jgi:hypothetical protein
MWVLRKGEGRARGMVNHTGCGKHGCHHHFGLGYDDASREVSNISAIPKCRLDAEEHKFEPVGEETSNRSVLSGARNKRRCLGLQLRDQAGISWDDWDDGVDESDGTQRSAGWFIALLRPAS